MFCGLIAYIMVLFQVFFFTCVLCNSPAFFLLPFCRWIKVNYFHNSSTLCKSNHSCRERCFKTVILRVWISFIPIGLDSNSSFKICPGCPCGSVGWVSYSWFPLQLWSPGLGLRGVLEGSLVEDSFLSLLITTYVLSHSNTLTNLCNIPFVIIYFIHWRVLLLQYVLSLSNQTKSYFKGIAFNFLFLVTRGKGGSVATGWWWWCDMGLFFISSGLLPHFVTTLVTANFFLLGYSWLLWTNDADFSWSSFPGGHIHLQTPYNQCF